MTQPGETDGFTARKHLEIARKYVPALSFDYVIVNDSRINPRQEELYNEEGAEQIGIHGSLEDERIEGAEVIRADLLAEGDKVRHDRSGSHALSLRGRCSPSRGLKPPFWSADILVRTNAFSSVRGPKVDSSLDHSSSTFVFALIRAGRSGSIGPIRGALLTDQKALLSLFALIVAT